MEVRKGWMAGVVMAGMLAGCAQMQPYAAPQTALTPGVSVDAQFTQFGAQATREGELLIITLPDTLGLSPQGVTGNALATLRVVAQYLNAGSGLGARIAAHTNTPTDSGEQKAQAVATSLTSLGINAGRLQVIGYGARYPVADMTSPDGAAQNGRVEIEIGRMK